MGGQGGADAEMQSMPALTMSRLEPVRSWWNVGQGSQTYDERDLSGDADKWITDLPGISNVLICWNGVKDLNAGLTAEQVEQKLADYCANRYAAGFDTIVVLTQTPKVSVEYEQNRLDYNNRLRANYSTYCDALVDAAAVPPLQNYNDTTYYVDQLHMTPAGYDVVASLVASALNDLGIT